MVALGWLIKWLIRKVSDPQTLYDIGLVVREVYNDILEDTMATYSADEVVEGLKKQIEAEGGNPNNVKMIIYDAKYRAPKLSTWERIASLDITKWESYINDFFDCDDYAFAFKCHAVEMFLINGVAVASGVSKDALGKDHGHAWNVLLVNDNEELAFYTFDVQRKKVVKGVYNVKYGMDTYTPDTIVL